MSRSPGAALVALALSLTAPQATAQEAITDCGRIGPLQGAALSTLSFDLPAAAAVTEIWAVLTYEGLPLALPVLPSEGGRGAMVLPLTLTLETAETVATTMLGLDAAGALVWLCEDLVVDVTPPPPRPGGTRQLAGTATRLAGRFDGVFPQGSDDTIGELAAIGSGLRGVAAELHTLAETAEADDLARADAILGAIAASLEARHPTAVRLRRPDAKFFPLAAIEGAPAALADACPADPRQLTEYIELGVRARVNTAADLQFMLTTSVTMFGVSGRLLNAGTIGSKPVDHAIDNAATAINTAQTLLTDYLAGMMPLNLERLEIRYGSPDFEDDTPPEARFFAIDRAILHTRSDGWSPDKAALDLLVGLATMRTGGVGGLVTGPSSSALRSGGASGTAAIAGANATRLQRIADVVAAQQGLPGGPPQHVVDLMRSWADEAATRATIAAEAAEVFARNRRAADVIDFGVAPVLGVIEGQATGQLTGAVGAQDVGPIGRQVSRCAVEMLRDADGARSRHLIFDVVEGDGEVLQVALGERIGFEVVGSGTRTARVQLNPALEYLPLTRQSVLPDARVEVRVGQIQGRIDGLSPSVAPWSAHSLSAWIGGVTLDPPLVWSVEPPLPLTVTGGRGVYTADLTIPEDTPEGTLITVSVRAEGDFISAAQVEPIWFAVAQVRSDDEEEEDAALTCAIHDGNRLRRLSPELNIAQRYAADATSFTEVWSNFCPRGSHARDFVSSLLPDALRAEQTAAGVVAWNGLPVHRIAGLHRVEAMLEARNTCMPETARGTVRDWLAAEAGQVETYLLGGCDMILLLGPQRGLLLEQQPIPGSPYWAIQYLHRQ